MKGHLMGAMGSRLFYQPGFFVMILVLPVLLSAVMGFVYQPQQGGAIPIAWVDEDQSQASVFLTDLMRQEFMVRLVETDRDDAMDRVRGYEVEGAYILPKGFEETMKRELIPTIQIHRSASSLGADAVGELMASGVIRIASHHRAAGIIIRSYEEQNLKVEDKEALRNEIIEHAETYWEDGPPIPLKVKEESRGFGEPQQVPRGILAAPYGALIAMMTFFAASLPMVIQHEKRAGTWQRVMLITGTEKAAYMATLYLYTLIQGGMALVTLLTLDTFFALRFWGTAGIAVFVLTMYGFLTTSLFIFIDRWGNIAKYSGSTTFVVLLLCLVGGCFWTTAIYPAGIQSVIMILPPAMAMAMMEKALINDFFPVGIGMLLWLGLGMSLVKKGLKTRI